MMDEGTLLIILLQINLGSKPPINNRNITGDQFIQISDAIESQIAIKRSYEDVGDWFKYRNKWQLQIKEQ